MHSAIKRAKEVITKQLDNSWNDDETVSHFNISYDTLGRYKRLMKEEGLLSRLPRILLFDIETLPMQVFVWGLYKQRIPHTNIVQDWVVVSWAAKWLFEPKIKSEVLAPDEAVKKYDKRILKGMWELFEEADIVIAHNAQRFDIRKLNARWLVNKINPPSAYQVIDTLKQTQRHFGTSSHKLDYLGQLLANKAKIETNFELWKKCSNGDPESLKYMVEYNREDVSLLEEVYLEIRPWIKSHPNLGLYVDINEPVCPNCGSTELNWGGYYYTTVSKFSSFRCECGAIGRCRTTALSLEKRKSLVTSVAR